MPGAGEDEVPGKVPALPLTALTNQGSIRHQLGSQAWLAPGCSDHSCVQGADHLTEPRLPGASQHGCGPVPIPSVQIFPLAPPLGTSEGKSRCPQARPYPRVQEQFLELEGFSHPLAMPSLSCGEKPNRKGTGLPKDAQHFFPGYWLLPSPPIPLGALGS